jgi:hypothetical protein
MKLDSLEWAAVLVGLMRIMRRVWNTRHKVHASKPRLCQNLSIGTPWPVIDLDRYSLARLGFDVWKKRQDCTLEILGELSRVHSALFIHSESDSVEPFLRVPELASHPLQVLESCNVDLFSIGYFRACLHLDVRRDRGPTRS